MSGEHYELVQYSKEAEQSVLGGMMLDGVSDRTMRVLSMLKADSFYLSAHKIIFAELDALVKSDKPIDLITLFDSIEEKGLTERVGGFAYLAELSKNTPSAANITHYAGIVKERAMERYGVSRLTDAIELLRERSGMSAEDKFDAISSIFSDLSTHAKTGSKKGLRKLGDVFEGWVGELEKRYSGDRSVRGMSTGLPSLDKLLAPKLIVKGSLFVIGARPKQGKTTTYTQLAVNCAITEDRPALMFSLEMPDDQLLEKIIGQKSGVSTDIFHPNPFDGSYDGDFDGDWNKAMGVANRLVEIGNLYIDDTPGMSLHDIVSESRRVYRERGDVGMILVDYLTLMKAEKAERNDLAYGMITKGLKNLAKELGCVVVLLTQLNRDLEKRQDKRPLPSDSRDTGQIEQDCDYWMGIYREGSYVDGVDPSLTELILRLNRHGETGTVHCIQRNGAIHDCDQQEAELKKRDRETKPHSRGDY